MEQVRGYVRRLQTVPTQGEAKVFLAYDAIIVTSQNFLTVLEHNAFEMMKLASYKALVLQGRVYIKYMKFYL